jgi:hypothetical protein
MQFTINIPDDVIDGYRHVLPPPEMGILEAIMVDAVMAALDRMLSAQEGPDA